MTVPAAWATCQDIGGRYAAIVSAFMNTIAGLSGALAGWATGSILEGSLVGHAEKLGTTVAALTPEQATAGLLHGYHVNFFIFAALYVVAFLCWFKIDPTKSLTADQGATPC